MRIVTLLAVALLAGCATPVPTAQTLSRQPDQAATLEADGAYTLEDVLGIGPKYAGKLREAGITTVAKLLSSTQTRAERQQVAQDTGIPYGNVLHIARKVELMKIHGIGVRTSNLLEAIGVDSVKELAGRNPQNLHDRLLFANHIGRPFMKVDPSLSAVTRWVREAQEMLAGGRAITE
jgi:predicted flap endonuclease-1-like 5' DNA nuclease